MRRLVLLLVACSSPHPDPVRPVTAPTDPTVVRIGPDTITHPAPVSAPIPPKPVPAWRAKLAESEHLQTLTHPGFDVADGFHFMEALVERSDRELGTLIAQLPDDSPDLPEAACLLAQHSYDRRNLETQLRRGIAAVRARANGDVTKLYGSMATSYLSVQVGAELRDGKLVRRDTEAILGGAASYSCAKPDVGRLGYQLAEAYIGEERYPKNPFTGEVDRGPYTTKRGTASAGLAELDGMYRELTALAPSHPAIATLIDIASIECDGKTTFSVCMKRKQAVARAIAIREAALPAGDEAVAETRVVEARFLVTAKRPGEAETILRTVLAQTPRGAEARIHAALDLSVLLRARRDLAGARALEPALIEDLEIPAGTSTYEWSSIGELMADVAHGDGRDADAILMIKALDKSLTTGNPHCVDSDTCDDRWTRAHLAEKLATLEPASAPAHLQQAAELRRQLTELRARKVDEVRALMARSP